MTGKGDNKRKSKNIKKLKWIKKKKNKGGSGKEMIWGKNEIIKREEEKDIGKEMRIR